jgi:ubiquinone/menaquinone biosynthesis C-methylase UbiE
MAVENILFISCWHQIVLALVALAEHGGRNYDTICPVMEHHDHVNLLRPADVEPGGTWADLGAGSGAFTLALRELAGPEANLYAVDKDARSLEALERNFQARFGSSSNLSLMAQDFSKPLSLPALDGVLMANSLHFFRQKAPILQHVRRYLKPGGILLLVEYDVDAGNMWVPYPISFESWRKLAPQAGFSQPRLLGQAPSRFLKGFYSAAAYQTANPTSSA